MPRRRFPRPALLVIIASLVVIVVAVGGYALAGTHQVLPGLRGCGLIRSVPAQSACVVDELQGVMASRSHEAGLKAVDALARKNPLVQSQCHLAMHPIGERYGAAAAKRGRFPDPTTGASTCQKGFMHGTMLGFVEHSGTTDVAAAMPRLCNDNALDEGNCAHVLGHLIARKAGRARAEASIASGCDAAGSVATATAGDSGANARDEAECVRGGYMEIALTARQPPLDVWRKRCEKSPDAVRDQCFAWLPPLAQYRQLGDRDAVRQCSVGGAASAWHDDCVVGVARVLGGPSPCRAFSAAPDRRRCSEVRATPVS